MLLFCLFSSSKLKRLSLRSCYGITGSGLSWAVKRLPQLEELRLSFISIYTDDIKVIGRNCPQLNSFMVYTEMKGTFLTFDDNALAIANNMPELRRLQLVDKQMTKIGLESILNSCPHLEYLYIRMCYDLDLDENLKKLCMERIKDFKFCHEVEDYYDYDDPISSRDVDYGDYSEFNDYFD